MGLGHFGGGVAAARWLARQGAAVTVTDTADERSLADSLAALAGEPIARFQLGGHREDDFRRSDLVVVNPAVRPGNRFVELARQHGARLTTEIELFLDRCPARIVGATGSNGKSTTAAMTAAILRASGRRTWLGGNIGRSLLDELPNIGPDDWVVLELSSFQLWHMGPQTPMPYTVVVTNCTPNHLDWHGHFADYVAAKQRILTGQPPDGVAVLNPLDAEVQSWRPRARTKLLDWYPPAAVPRLAVPGEHNRVNAACAATAALGLGCTEREVGAGLERFGGLPQRLELVAVAAGRRFYNDSSSTTPESTIAALTTLEGPAWLLAGGSDKGIELAALAEAVAARTCGAALFGAVRRRLQDLIRARAEDFPCAAVETMADALTWCSERSRPGDAIVLSPACASKDQFANFRRRGETFDELVRNLKEVA